MASKPKRIKVPAGSELGKLLKEAGEHPVVLETNGELYRLGRIQKEPKDDLWEGYDPEKVREVVKKYAGTITEEEAEAWIADLYRTRKEGSRPVDRP